MFWSENRLDQRVNAASSGTLWAIVAQFDFGSVLRCVAYITVGVKLGTVCDGSEWSILYSFILGAGVRFNLTLGRASYGPH
jgi:hypothetical protein